MYSQTWVTWMLDPWIQNARHMVSHSASKILRPLAQANVYRHRLMSKSKQTRPCSNTSNIPYAIQAKRFISRALQTPTHSTDTQHARSILRSRPRHRLLPPHPKARKQNHKNPAVKTGGGATTLYMLIDVCLTAHIREGSPSSTNWCMDLMQRSWAPGPQ